jgi:hypothetical protein
LKKRVFQKKFLKNLPSLDPHLGPPKALVLWMLWAASARLDKDGQARPGPPGGPGGQGVSVMHAGCIHSPRVGGGQQPGLPLESLLSVPRQGRPLMTAQATWALLTCVLRSQVLWGQCQRSDQNLQYWAWSNQIPVGPAGSFMEGAPGRVHRSPEPHDCPLAGAIWSTRTDWLSLTPTPPS